MTVFRQPKKEVTKRFVQQDIEPEADSTELLAELIKENPSGRLATLTFSGFYPRWITSIPTPCSLMNTSA